eukprot:GHVP01043961.1.p1 GENE.GHVP01043961.1~~GHVP01043961.1.p1  ORF type:complete len:187 (+),score=19.40 GHVP01043961.1:30-563(+)
MKLQKRLAADILRCGRARVWFDPAETEEISLTNTRFAMRKLIRDGMVIRKKSNDPTRYRTRLYHDAKRRGRHTGPGKRKGTAEARMSSKLLWIRRQRCLRRLLKKFRESKKIDRHMYHMFYLKAKGNLYKNKRVLIEAIHHAQNEAVKQKNLKEQQEAKLKKAAEKREKKAAKQAQK